MAADGDDASTGETESAARRPVGDALTASSPDPTARAIATPPTVAPSGNGDRVVLDDGHAGIPSPSVHASGGSAALGFSPVATSPGDASPTATSSEGRSRRGRRTAGEDGGGRGSRRSAPRGGVVDPAPAPTPPAAAYPPGGYRDMIDEWALNATTWTMVNAGVQQPHPAWSPATGYGYDPAMAGQTRRPFDGVAYEYEYGVYSPERAMGGMNPHGGMMSGPSADWEHHHHRAMMGYPSDGDWGGWNAWGSSADSGVPGAFHRGGDGWSAGMHPAAFAHGGAYASAWAPQGGSVGWVSRGIDGSDSGGGDGGRGARGRSRGARGGGGGGDQTGGRKLFTVYVRNVHSEVTERELALAFAPCGPVVDCRLCTDPSGEARFAFVAFNSAASARAALGLSGATVGKQAVRVMPSRTSVIPVNPKLLPQTAEEVKRCARTVYVANLEASASDDELEAFFRDAAGAVSRLVTHVNPRNGSRMAFVEFETPEGARAALRCAGRVFGSRALRVGPSKTPLRVAGSGAGAGTAGGAAAESAASESAAAVASSDQPSSPRRGRRRGARGRTEAGSSRRDGHGQGQMAGPGVGWVGPLDDREPKMWHSVHVRGVASSISESTLARVFAGCGRVIDCRLSGEGRSRFRFAFVAFASEGEVEQALGLDGLVLEGSEIRVQRSKTAIIPVNPHFLPRSEAEMERCRRTVYAANVCPNLTEAEVRDTFEKMCGPVSGIHLQMSNRKEAQVAFVEFADAGSAETALGCSGRRVGTRAVRVTPSKTPLRLTSARGTERDAGDAEAEIEEAKSDEASRDDPETAAEGEDDAAARAVASAYAAAAEEMASATAKLSVVSAAVSDGDSEEHETAVAA